MRAVLEALAEAAATAYGAPSAAHVMPAPGTQILLPLVCGLVRPGRAAILAPTYSEHARAAALAGHAVAEIRDLGAIGNADLVIVTNPNNPDGRLFAKDDLLAVAKALSSRGGVLVVDEAFMDVGPPGASLAPEIGRGNIVVLRSFGKFFGLAGLRLGFALAAPPLAARLAALLGPWAVSAPALAVGTAALADRDWIEKTRRRLAEAAARLDAILNGAGLDIVGGTTLFRLVPDASGRRIVPPSRTRRHSDARFPRSCRVAALRPAGRRAGLAAVADCDGRVSRQPLGFESMRARLRPQTEAAAPAQPASNSITRSARACTTFWSGGGTFAASGARRCRTARSKR